MADNDKNTLVQQRPYWLPDIQGFLALGILLFVFIAFVVLIYGPTNNVKAEILSAVMLVLGVLTGSLKDVYSYFFPGSKDMTGNSDAIREIAMQPSAPAPTTVSVVPWWTKLSDSEKTAIAAAQGLGSVSPDARVSAFVTASQVGSATPDDLNYLVSKGLLTQARANEIKGGT